MPQHGTGLVLKTSDVMKIALGVQIPLSAFRFKCWNATIGTGSVSKTDDVMKIALGVQIPLPTLYT